MLLLKIRFTLFSRTRNRNRTHTNLHGDLSSILTLFVCSNDACYIQILIFEIFIYTLKSYFAYFKFFVPPKNDPLAI